MQKSGNFDEETDLEKDIVEKALGRIKCNYYEAAKKKEYQSKIDINKTKMNKCKRLADQFIQT